MDKKDNDSIIGLLQDRMEKGLNEYKQGVEVRDSRYSWTKEALEEILDGMIYIAAAILRFKNEKVCPKCKCNIQEDL